MKRLILIDAANTLYRAFFALPPLRNSAGFPTGAVLGLANMLRKVLREQSPDAVLAALDPPGGSFRKKLYPQYKAQRDAQPEDLSAQAPVMRELFEAWRIPMLEVPDFEADDVIATLVEQAPEDFEVLVVSTDKDLMQLVGKRVALLDTMKDRRIGPAEVEERFGVGPGKLLDMRALVGDPSDNIPGVPGIGEKGAAKLIAEFGTLDELLDQADKVKAKRAREGLTEHADAARLSRQLATLRRDAPLELKVEELVLQAPDQDALRELYTRLEFTRLLDEIGAAKPAPAKAAPPPEVEVIADAAAFDQVLAALSRARRLALAPIHDAGGGALASAPAGLALAFAGRNVYLPFAHGSLLNATGISCEAALPELARRLSEKKAPGWVARDSKRVQTLFAGFGAELPLPAFDSEIAAFMLDPAGPRDTAALSLQWLGRAHENLDALTGRGAKAVPAAELELPRVSAFAGAEARALLELEAPLTKRHESDGTAALYREVELPLTAVLSRMERAGVRIDEKKLARLSKEYTSELQRLETRIHEAAGEKFQMASPKQLQHILFEKLGLPAGKKTKTGYSTDESVLEQLALQHELPGDILAWRRLAKLKSTYVDALPPLVNPDSGRIHPSFNQVGAATGRLSSSGPNVQNIPIRTEEGARIREAFIPAKGCVLLCADYSQVELRVMAHYSGDAGLQQAFAQGDDIHRLTAAEVHGIPPEEVTGELRAAAKAINFGIIYGSSAFGIARQLRIPKSEAQALIDRTFERYPGVRKFLDQGVERAREAGFVQTLLGRRRYLPDLSSRNRTLRQAAERMAINTIIQGTAADMIKKAMVEVDAALPGKGPKGARMILQVHDELVFEVPAAGARALGALLREIMEQVCALDVPLVVDLGSGPNWRAAH